MAKHSTEVTAKKTPLANCFFRRASTDKIALRMVANQKMPMKIYLFWTAYSAIGRMLTNIINCILKLKTASSMKKAASKSTR